MDELRNLLNRVADSCNAARAHYQIWFTLRGEGKARSEYLGDMNESAYVDFFHANNSGHYKLMFIELGCLFDPDDRVASLSNLKVKLNEADFQELVEKINGTLGQHHDLVRNVLTIRSKLIAHKEIGADSETIHRQFGVVPDQVGKLLSECGALLNELNEEVFGCQSNLLAFSSNRYESATYALLEALRKGRS